MSDLNAVAIIGRVTRDAELKALPSGTSVCNFSIGVNRSIPPKDGGEWKNEASFFDCQLWGKTAETRAAFLLKGKQVAVAGELRQDRWDQDGQTRSRVYIVVSAVQLLADPRPKDGANTPSGTPASGQPHAAKPTTKHPMDDFEDEIPF